MTKERKSKLNYLILLFGAFEHNLFVNSKLFYIKNFRTFEKGSYYAK
jgi:hypothetical protein